MCYIFALSTFISPVPSISNLPPPSKRGGVNFPFSGKFASDAQDQEGTAIRVKQDT